MTGGMCLLHAHIQGARGFVYIEDKNARVTARGLRPGGDAALCLRGGGVTRVRVSDSGNLDAVLPLRGGETVLLIACDAPPRPALSAALGDGNLPPDAVAMLCEDMCRALVPCEPIRQVPPDAGERRKRKRPPAPRPTLRRAMPVAKAVSELDTPSVSVSAETLSPEMNSISDAAQESDPDLSRIVLSDGTPGLEQPEIVPLDRMPEPELPVAAFADSTPEPENAKTIAQPETGPEPAPAPDAGPSPSFRARGDEPSLSGLVPLVWPPAAEPLKPYFLTLPPCAPFDAPGWRFVRVPMPRGGGLSHCAVGYKAHQRVVREIACAVPGSAEQAPPGLHGYRWQAGRDSPGYWTLWKRV